MSLGSFTLPALTALTAALLVAVTGCASDTRSMPSVSLLEPANGARVSSPFKVRFGAKGLTVAPAGEVAAASGHHHLLINREFVPSGESIPFDTQHMHFGKGQTEADVSLPPGTYKLTAQFANGAHQSYGKALSQTIMVTVK